MSLPELADLPAAFFYGQDQRSGLLVPDLVAPDYQAEIAGFPVMDAVAHGEFGRAFYAAFPDLRHTLEEVVVAPPQVTVRFTLRGTHRGAFFGVPATGRVVSVAAIALLTTVGGRVTSLRAIFDRAGLLEHLGVLPSARPAA